MGVSLLARITVDPHSCDGKPRVRPQALYRRGERTLSGMARDEILAD